MKTFKFILFALVISSVACSKQGNYVQPVKEVEFESFGLPGITINDLQLYSNYLYAATSYGVYRKNTALFTAEWEELGHRGQNIMAMWIFSTNNIIVSTYDKNAPELSSVFETIDGGSTWQPHQGNWGGGTKEPMFDIVADPNNPDVLYASGSQVVAKTEDKGLNWTPIWNDWGMMGPGIQKVGMDPNNPGMIWAGGQNDLNESVLLYNDNFGGLDAWQYHSEVVSSPNSVTSISFDEINNQTYVGYQGNLLRTLNHGNTWKTVLTSDDNRWFAEAIVDPSITNVIYAAGWIEEYDLSQPLKLFRSTDNGTTWKMYEDNSPGLMGGVKCMVFKEDAFQKHLYLGLYKGGVYLAKISK